MALFPVEVFSRNDPLIIRSFETYYEKWFALNKGGFTHAFAHWWPYAGLDLARDYLRLGRQDLVHEILGWTLQHQTLPGTYAWSEQMSRDNGGIRGGDMPHAWAASSFISLVREMLVMPFGDRLELFAGVPASWLESGKTVGVRDLPTEFGSLTALIESGLTTSDTTWKGQLRLTIDGSARPPGGFAWKLDQPPTWIDGPPGTRMSDGWLIIPSSGGTVRLGYGTPKTD
ncbi:MAG: hypothetical protein K6W08_13545 [Firmicutes bacterium]|nr:hypothetical protein [Bacillota bacterium]